MDLGTVDLDTAHNQLTLEDQRLHLYADVQLPGGEEWRLAEAGVFGDGEIVRDQASGHDGETKRQSAGFRSQGEMCWHPRRDERLLLRVWVVQ
jgi:hypothetical protein